MIRGMGVRCAIRGSGAGSLVNYLIKIGEVNPLEHGLLMERFLSEGRVELPDIDVDVESARRLDCYRAILDRYGESRVACVSMMETYRARAPSATWGRRWACRLIEIDAIAKAFPARPGQADPAPPWTTCPNCVTAVSTIGPWRRSSAWPNASTACPGTSRCTRAASLVGNMGLRGRTPVERSLLEFPMSQFDKDDVEDAGLLKLDVLGVRMQSAMAYALRRDPPGGRV